MMPGAPKYATKRDPSRKTFGRRVAHVSHHVLGAPFMPWQNQVVDVGMELDPEEPGAFYYDTVIITVPRQAGKTLLHRAVAVDRLLAYRDHLIRMTAQTGKAASRRWQQIVSAVDVDSHPDIWHRAASRGSEALTYKRSGSVIEPFPPTETDGHGDTLHLVMLDEAWAFSEAEGIALDAAINPTMLTVLGSQKWIVSTKGTAKSAYLNRLIAEGRKAVHDHTSRTAFFEWSADEELVKVDPYGAETLAFHPAIGHTQTHAKMLRLGGKEHLATWKRSYLNLDDLSGSSAIINLAVWDDLASPDPLTVPDPASVVISYDIASDLSAASIYAAWTTSSGEGTATLLSTAPGHTWIKDELLQLDAQGFTNRVADEAGPVVNLTADLETLGYPTSTTSTKEAAIATQWLIAAAKSGDICHDGAPATRQALEGATARYVAGMPLWDIRRSAGPIDSLRALTLAVHRAATTSPGQGLYF